MFTTPSCGTVRRTKSKSTKFWSSSEPRKNTIYERYVFFSRGQESGESIDKYATVFRNMADNCGFRKLRDSLICDLGVSDNHVRERLLRVPDLALEKASEISRAAEATQSQLKQMQNIQEVNESRNKNERTPKEKFEGKKATNGGEHIDCKFCGRRHVRDRTKSYPKELFTTVRVNNCKDVTFQLDCGATCNLLPQKEFSSISKLQQHSRCIMDILCIHLESALSDVPEVMQAKTLISLLVIRMSGHC